MAGIALPIKDALRGVRSGMTAGRIAVEPLRGALPAPARGLIGELISSADFFVNEFDKASSLMARNLFGDGPVWQRDGCWSLGQLAARPDGEMIFGPLAYGVLLAAYQRFADTESLVSEARAASAFRTAVDASQGDQVRLPSELLVAMQDEEVIHGSPFTDRIDPEAARLSFTAFVLWLLIDRTSDADDNDLLDVCCDAARYVDARIASSLSEPEKVTAEFAACARLI